jgi:hypothetical protein
MRFGFRTTSCAALAAVLVCPQSTPRAAGSTASHSSHSRTIWNYDGGVYMVTDGGFPSGPCFRLHGRVTAPVFFDNLKRIDFDNADSIFRRGNEVVTQYPDEVLLDFFLYDQPCPDQLAPRAGRTYLTRELVGKLRLNLYWKHGIDLRPVDNVTKKHFSVQARAPYSSTAPDLPERYEWSYVYAIPSAGVPLTDNLVLIIRTPDDRIAARVAARM